MGWLCTHLTTKNLKFVKMFKITPKKWHFLEREGGCVDLSIVTLHLKDPLVLFGFESFFLNLNFLCLLYISFHFTYK